MLSEYTYFWPLSVRLTWHVLFVQKSERDRVEIGKIKNTRGIRRFFWFFSILNPCYSMLFWKNSLFPSFFTRIFPRVFPWFIHHSIANFNIILAVFLDFRFFLHSSRNSARRGSELTNSLLKISHQNLFLIENIKTLCCLSKKVNEVSQFNARSLVYDMWSKE